MHYKKKLPGKLKFTDREKEILPLLVDGKSNSQIADELFVSIHTVKFYVKSLCEKLEVDNRISVAVCSVLLELISQDKLQELKNRFVKLKL